MPVTELTAHFGCSDVSSNSSDALISDAQVPVNEGSIRDIPVRLPAFVKRCRASLQPGRYGSARGALYRPRAGQSLAELSISAAGAHRSCRDGDASRHPTRRHGPPQEAPLGPGVEVILDRRGCDRGIRMLPLVKELDARAYAHTVVRAALAVGHHLKLALTRPAPCRPR